MENICLSLFSIQKSLEKCLNWNLHCVPFMMVKLWLCDYVVSFVIPKKGCRDEAFMVIVMLLVFNDWLSIKGLSILFVE